MPLGASLAYSKMRDSEQVQFAHLKHWRLRVWGPSRVGICLLCSAPTKTRNGSNASPLGIHCAAQAAGRQAGHSQRAGSTPLWGMGGTASASCTHIFSQAGALYHLRGHNICILSQVATICMKTMTMQLAHAGRSSVYGWLQL